MKEHRSQRGGEGNTKKVNKEKLDTKNKKQDLLGTTPVAQLRAE